jgi:hypothetical protein
MPYFALIVLALLVAIIIVGAVGAYRHFFGKPN